MGALQKRTGQARLKGQGRQAILLRHHQLKIRNLEDDRLEIVIISTINSGKIKAELNSFLSGTRGFTLNPNRCKLIINI